jgi:copper transport protein
VGRASVIGAFGRRRDRRRSPGRRVRNWLLVVLAACLVLPAVAVAHATLDRSDPLDGQVVQTSPAKVTLTFSEPVETALGAIRVFDGDARRVDQGDPVRESPNVVSTAVQPNLARGTYTVSWRVGSADGHPIDGAFVFHVGAPGEHPEGIASEVRSRPPTVIDRASDVARFVDLALVILVVGGIAALVLVLAGRAPDVERRLWYLAAGCGFALSIVAGASILLHAASVAGVGLNGAARGNVLQAVLDTRFGQVRLAQVILAELVAIGAVWAAASDGNTRGKKGVAIAAAALALTPGLGGHAGAGSALAVIADTGHVLAASMWVGGLATVVLALVMAGPGRRELAPQVWPRFSTAALASVAVLLVAGVIGSFQNVDEVSELWETTYGRLLMAKMAIALVLIGFGVANRRMVRGLREDGEEGGLRRSTVFELGLMAVAIAVTSVLVNQPPGRAVAAAAPVEAKARIDDLAARVTVDPAKTGSNVVSVFLERQGQPVSADEVSVTATAPADVGPFRLQTRPAEPGHYIAPPLEAPVAGVWSFEIAVRRGEFNLKAATVSIPIKNAR